MEHTTEVEYTSIYDRRLGKLGGRPKGTCKLSDEERREKARVKSTKYYDMNPEKERETKIEYARTKNQENISLENQLCVWLSEDMYFFLNK